MQKYVVRLVFALVVILGPLLAVVATDTHPQLGLDLQGGISVVLGPKHAVKSDALDKALEIIRNRVDALGVAEPEISRQGTNILVDLPGVKNRERARSLVGQTAELRFRPVLQQLPGEKVDLSKLLSTTTTGKKSDKKSTDTSSTTTTTGKGSTTTTVKGPTTTQSTAKTKTQNGYVVGAPATTTSAPASTTTVTTGAAASTTTTTGKVAAIPTSKEDDPKQIVVLPIRKEEQHGIYTRLQLGPAELTGKAVKTASAEFDGQWRVRLVFTKEGSKGFDAIGAKYYQRQVAIVLDGIVQSFPTIQAKEFKGEASITGSFTQKQARDLATVLRYGALPVALEERQVNQISPTLGRDQLRSGIAAGLVGLGLVAIYMVLYYRMLGLVIWGGLLLAAGALYALTSWLSNSIGLTLTLAGVTGIIVSVGITVDSYVVYFERLKDEVRSGKTIRSSLDRGFSRSFRTILAADFVSFIGAVLLYLLTVGSVRGFAFFLGLSTILDVFVAYFFMHPLVAIIARNPKFTRARWLGVASGLGAKGATA